MITRPPRLSALYLFLCIVSLAGVSPSQSFVFSPTTTLTAETANNTSGAASFASQSNGNAAAGNISKLPISRLLYPGANTQVYAHFMPWFGPSNHMNVGYDSADPVVIARQLDDMLSRGIEGVLIDWYGPNSVHNNTTAINLMKEAEIRGGQFTFSIQEDVGALKPCASTPGCDVTQRMIDDLNYAYSTFGNSPAYMFVNGRPIVSFFGVEAYTIDWDRVRANVLGNPVFIFRNSTGFSHLQSDGSFSWISVTTDPTNMGVSYLDNFYKVGLTFPAEHTFGSSYKGFNDTLAAWTKNRIMNQQCGQTWLSSFAVAGKYYSAANQLEAFQIVTWNDYEEGTEIETGIDNCLSITGSVNSTALSWTINGQQNTIDHFTAYISDDGENLMPLADISASARSFDVSGLNLPKDTYKFFVKATGQPSITNKFSPAIPYNNLPPTVQLALSPSSGSVPLSMAATVSAYDSDGTIASSLINFGDGTVAPGTWATHQYGAAGNYTVTAIAVDDSGASTSASRTVTVTPPAVLSSVVVSPLSVVGGTAALGTVNLSTPAPSSGSVVQLASSNAAAAAAPASVTVTAGSTSAQFTISTKTVGASVTVSISAVYSGVTKGSSLNVLPAVTTVSCAVPGTRTVNLCSPVAGSAVASPVHVVAAASGTAVASMSVSIDGVSKYSVAGNRVDTYVAVASGARRVTVTARDSAGYYWKTVYFTVK